MSEWTVFARYDDYDDRLVVAAAHKDTMGKRSFIQAPLTLRTYEEGALVENADVDLVRDMDGQAFLQAMLDAAWKIGLRPRDFADHKNELTAVRYHLEDMRKLAKVTG